MANKQVTLKRVIDTSGNTDTIHPTTDWAQVESKPSTFTPTSHSHGLISNAGKITSNTAIASGDRLVFSNYSDGGTLVNSSITFGTGTTTFLRNDGTWATPSDVDTNNYLTGVSGSGDGTVTFTRNGLSNLTWDASHSHSEYLPLSGGTMTGTLEFTTSNTPIKLKEDHFIYRKIDATTEAVTGQSQAYILLCRNAGGNDVNGTITMDRTSGLRHASFVDILISAGSSSGPVGTMRSMSTAGNSNPTYKLVTLTYSSNSYVALSIYNPDTYYDTSGMYFTGRIKTTDTSNEFLMLPASSVTSVSDFGTNESHQINGDKIWHAGNDGSGSGLDADTVDGIHASAFVRSDASDTMSGDYRIESGSFASLILDRGTTGAGSIVQFENNNGIIGGVGAYGDDGLQFRTKDGTQMLITSSNIVGIGTTSPKGKLQIHQDTLDTAALFISRYNNEDYALFQVGEVDTFGGVGSYGGSVVNASNRTLVLNTQDLTGSTIASANRPDLAITSAGNVGIGTSSPASPLHAYKNTSSGSNVISLETLNNKWDFRIGNSGEFLIRDGSYDRLTINNSNGNATFANDLTVQGDLYVNGSFTTIDTDTTTTEQWSVTNDGTGPAVIINQKGSQPVIDIQDDSTSVFYIEDGGNVGIGTTNPAYKLDVASSARVQGDFVASRLVDYGNGNYYVDPASTSNLNVVDANLFEASSASSRDKFRVYPTNQYTIGMQSGVSYGGLNSDWAMTFQMNNDNDRGFWWGDQGHSTAQGAMSLTTQGLLTVARGARIGYGESDTTAPVSGVINLKTNGSVPDSTTATYEKGLTIVGGNQRLNIDVSNVTNGGAYIQSRHESTTYPTSEYTLALNPQGGNVTINGNTAWHAGNDGAGSGLDADLLDGNHATDFVAVAGDTMTGNLSIENGAPSLTLKDTTDSDDIRIYFRNNSNSNVAELTTTGNRLNINTTFSNGLSIDADKVGIGTTSPGSPLTVAGTIESLPVSSSEGGDLRLRAATGKSYQYTIDNYNDTLRFIRQDDTTGSSGQVRMLIDSSGKVGIGTASPTQSLEVNGNTRTSSSLIAGANLYLNDDNTAADTYVYFGDAASDTAHYLRFTNASQQFTFSNRVVASAGRLGAIEYNGSDVDKVNFALSGSTLTITTS